MKKPPKIIHNWRHWFNLRGEEWFKKNHRETYEYMVKIKKIKPSLNTSMAKTPLSSKARN